MKYDKSGTGGDAATPCMLTMRARELPIFMLTIARALQHPGAICDRLPADKEEAQSPASLEPRVSHDGNGPGRYQ
jgi:hypothetical protein